MGGKIVTATGWPARTGALAVTIAWKWLRCIRLYARRGGEINQPRRSSRPNIPQEFKYAEQSLSRLTSRPAAGLAVINQLPEA